MLAQVLNFLLFEIKTPRLCEIKFTPIVNTATIINYPLVTNISGHGFSVISVPKRLT